MKQKTVLVAVALVGAFLLGCIAGGAIVFFRTVPATAEMLALANLSHAGSEAYVRYRYGAYPVAKTALLKYADQVNRVVGTEGTTGPGGASFDLGLTYGRLAIAAERAGHADEATQYMSIATKAFSRRGQQVDEAQVRASVERLDKVWDQRLTAQAP